MEKNFFDMMVQEVLPSVRALMARKLLEHGFSQKQAAEKLGLTQPAISQYKRNLWGFRKDFLDMMVEFSFELDHRGMRSVDKRPGGRQELIVLIRNIS